jgi:hypothetical protein
MWVDAQISKQCPANDVLVIIPIILVSMKFCSCVDELTRKFSLFRLGGKCRIINDKC